MTAKVIDSVIPVKDEAGFVVDKTPIDETGLLNLRKTLGKMYGYGSDASNLEQKIGTEFRAFVSNKLKTMVPEIKNLDKLATIQSNIGKPLKKIIPGLGAGFGAYELMKILSGK